MFAEPMSFFFYSMFRAKNEGENEHDSANNLTKKLGISKTLSNNCYTIHDI